MFEIETREADQAARDLFMRLVRLNAQSKPDEPRIDRIRDELVERLADLANTEA